MKSQSTAWHISGKVFLALWVPLCAFPFLWMFMISIRSPVDAFAFPPKLFADVTFEHFYQVWVVDGFWQNALSSVIVTVGTVVVSLTIGCLAGYALSRYRGSVGFWLLIIALVFRALPHVVLLTSYKPAFFELGIWNRYETLIMVLVAINQPFTIWMLRSFFMNIPNELDEAALVDGCGRIQAFFRVIMPVMWPGVITTGLFSFLLGYNDFLITSQLMDGDHMTMTAALSNYIYSDENLAKVLEGVAGAVSVTIPLIILVLVFQKQLVSGLVQGAVKG
ncbi:carbohydrate ABC transporter permease [Zobellella maritima]|uniref:carbohydrate ABC transporter permease n=1 Tax=Zobellella maritima TaxID=2059725 RepID=UPI000E2FF83F|nr:carbohydrate ABC transporter permease [Zobellella maritima]